MNTLAASALRFAFLTVLGALVISLLTVGANVFAGLSRFDVFSRIQLGMGKTEVISLLREHRISCEYTPFTVEHESRCRFSDVWREYTISLDDSGRVSRKFLSFKRQKTLIDRIMAIGRS
jgi:hypothetical protein